MYECLKNMIVKVLLLIFFFEHVGLAVLPLVGLGEKPVGRSSTLGSASSQE